MKTYQFDGAWVGDRWVTDARISIDAHGMIVSVDSEPANGDREVADIEKVTGFAVPGIANVHSHAFQWTFAARSEFRTRERDSFWSWREQMYQSLAGLNVEAYYQSAKHLFSMMAAQGYTSVGEFHYVHHPDLDDSQHGYAMADAMIRAATEVGLAICILPVLYQRGGFDGQSLKGAQARFELDDESFLALVEKLNREWSDHPNVIVGMAFHSLRAVDPEKIRRVVEAFRQLDSGRLAGNPIHIHVAEQIAEVEASEAATGMRPVELLLHHADVDEHWCLIHATHLSDNEIRLIADSRAVVGLCPTTEANLGDGVFPAESFLKAGGRFAVGSDSHIAVDPFAELRLIEYGQRLTKHRRSVLCREGLTNGETLFQSVTQNGGQAMGIKTGKLATGYRADLIVLDPQHPMVVGAGERLLDRVVFGQYGNPVSHTFVLGNLIHRR